MQEDFLSRCVIDVVTRKFYLYSENGDERVIDCETIDQFMAVLELVRDICPEDCLAYADPLEV
jgi:hypothetical protein|tara:strand:+ start:54 stop:242 length:189 start_codon:yes stop_codon:yes gene_type:complete